MAGNLQVKTLLRQQPAVIEDYFDAASARHAFISGDRFPAIAQTVMGVMCFTPEAVDMLKSAVLAVMGEQPSRFAGRAIIDNAGWGQGMSGSTSTVRVLAGRPCPGDHFDHNRFLLQEPRLLDAQETEVQVQGVVEFVGLHTELPVKAKVSQNVLVALYVQEPARQALAALPGEEFSQVLRQDPSKAASRADLPTMDDSWDALQHDQHQARSDLSLSRQGASQSDGTPSRWLKGQIDLPPMPDQPAVVVTTASEIAAVMGARQRQASSISIELELS